MGAGEGITFLHGGGLSEVTHTIVNALAIVSGVVCDGAKPSCAGKIAGILGFHMYQNGQQFYGGEGLVRKGVENTIINIGRLGRVGMKEIDNEIIKGLEFNKSAQLNCFLTHLLRYMKDLTTA